MPLFICHYLDLQLYFILCYCLQSCFDDQIKHPVCHSWHYSTACKNLHNELFFSTAIKPSVQPKTDTPKKKKKHKSISDCSVSLLHSAARWHLQLLFLACLIISFFFFFEENPISTWNTHKSPGNNRAGSYHLIVHPRWLRTSGRKLEIPPSHLCSAGFITV